MREGNRRVAIVDYGLGNLYSVQRACAHVGLPSVITGVPDEVAAADGVILPGVGAMPTAMERLRASGLGEAIRAVADRGVPLFGICLGMQLLMREGSEFGRHEGLGIIDGEVIRFDGTSADGRPLRVPHIGWNAVLPLSGASPWSGTPLEDVAPGSEMYFVHSYYVVPADSRASIATSQYGSLAFCAALAQRNIFACQFHPERSGPVGLTMYARFAEMLSPLTTR